MLQLYQGLQLCGELKGVKISFALAKNNRKLASEMETLNTELRKLQEENSVKDADGNPIVKDGKYEMVDMEKFNEEYKKLMDIDVEISLHKIKASDVPVDISASQMSIILDLIEE
jgi:hypothetical protein